jgi:mRNA interferase MazF
MDQRGLVIRQGEVYRVSFSGRCSEPWGRRPALVLQHNRFNHSRLNTVVVVAITSTLRYATLPGNIRLRKGEANLPKPCVVNVTQIQTIDRTYLREKIGTLPQHVLRQVWEGVRLVLEVNGEGSS